MLPEVLKNFNTFAEDQSYLGVCEEVVLPVIEFDQEEFMSGGMLGPLALDKGFKAMSMSINLGGWSPQMLALLENVDVAGLGLRFAGALQRDEPGAPVSAVEVSVRARVAKLDFGTAKKGDLNKQKTDFPVSYYKFTQDGTTLVELDFLNLVYRVNGTDQLAAIRQAIQV